MILVQIKNSEIKVKGHADFAAYGSDIVCAGVSMLVTTVAEQLFKIKSNIIINLNEGDSSFKWQTLTSEEELLIETLKTGFQLINESYTTYIEIEEVA